MADEGQEVDERGQRPISSRLLKRPNRGRLEVPRHEAHLRSNLAKLVDFGVVELVLRSEPLHVSVGDLLNNRELSRCKCDCHIIYKKVALSPLLVKG